MASCDRVSLGGAGCAGNPRDECRNGPYWKADDWSDDGWGGEVESSDPPGDGAITLDDSGYPPTVTYTVNTDLTLVAVYVKAATDLYDAGTSGTITWSDDNPDISHITFCFDDGLDDTTTTADEDTTSTAVGDTTTTIDDGTTVTQAEVTTTEAGDATTTEAGDTTSTGTADTTTTTIGGVTVTSDPGATTTSGDGPAVTEGEGPGIPPRPWRSEPVV